MATPFDLLAVTMPRWTQRLAFPLSGKLRMHMITSHPGHCLKTDNNIDQRLAELWGNRARLDEAGWGELYRIILQVLMRSRARELAALTQEREEYIHKFFLLKVFEPARHDSSPVRHAGALHEYFRRFLLDEIRGLKIRDTVPLDDADHAEEDSVSTQPSGAHFGPHYPKAVECGFNEEEAFHSAQHFLRAAESWVVLYLSLHFCPDDDDAMPLSRLAQRYRIASYHYRAKQLGITARKGELPETYGETMLGGWLSTLTGEAFRSGMLGCYLTALGVLCALALQMPESIEERGA